jgi:ferritin-like metal-binding protein YciE
LFAFSLKRVCLIKETVGVTEEAKGQVARHAMIIGWCQEVAHYEISRYGMPRDWAKALGKTEAHDLLSGILDQEKVADHKPTHIAIAEINRAAE